MIKRYLSAPNFACLFLFFIIYTTNSTAQSWEQLGSPPFLTDHSYGFGIDGKAYVIQGNNGNPLWEYNPTDDSWTEIGDFPGPSRGFPVGDEWDGKYYYGFGTLSGNAMNDLWVFDPADESFTELPSCPCTPRYHPAFIAHNDKIMMGTGSTGNGDLQDWWEYDIITQVWTQKQNIPGGNRHHPFFFSAGNSVFLGGGHRPTWFEYNLDTEELTAIDNTPLGRVAGTQFQYDGKGFLLAGDDATHSHVPQSQTFMFYDPQLGEWGYLPPLPEGSRWASSSFIIDDILYHFDGVDYDTPANSSVWKFDLSKLNCLPPSNLNVSNLDETTADLSWITYAGTVSALRWRKVDTDWIEVSNAQPVFSLENLEPCQQYEFQMFSTCGTDTTYSEVFEFQSKGCGSCIDLDYCESQQFFNNNDAFISKVEINSFSNTSGENDMGYENFTVPTPEEIAIGDDFTLTVEVSEFNDGSKLKVWMDLDQDGNFENSEILADESISSGTLTTDISVPNSALTGITRIRISYGISNNPNASINLTSCVTSTSQFIDGEAEDYCINLLESTSTDDQLKNISLSTFPNPFQNTVHIKGDFPFGKKYELKILNIMGETISIVDDFSMSDEINLSNIPSGVYFLQIEDGEVSYQARVVKQN